MTAIEKEGEKKAKQKKNHVLWEGEEGRVRLGSVEKQIEEGLCVTRS